MASPLPPLEALEADSVGDSEEEAAASANTIVALREAPTRGLVESDPVELNTLTAGCFGGAAAAALSSAASPLLAAFGDDGLMLALAPPLHVLALPIRARPLFPFVAGGPREGGGGGGAPLRPNDVEVWCPPTQSLNGVLIAGVTAAEDCAETEREAVEGGPPFAFTAASDSPPLAGGVGGIVLNERADIGVTRARVVGTLGGWLRAAEGVGVACEVADAAALPPPAALRRLRIPPTVPVSSLFAAPKTRRPSLLLHFVDTAAGLLSSAS